jgi:hypothetical protein
LAIGKRDDCWLLRHYQLWHYYIFYTIWLIVPCRTRLLFMVYVFIHPISNEVASSCDALAPEVGRPRGVTMVGVLASAAHAQA